MNSLQKLISCKISPSREYYLSMRKKKWTKFVGKPEERPQVERSAVVENAAPEWGDVRDVRKLFGLRQSFAYELMRTGRIKSVLVPGRGHLRGKRLINLDSLRRLLEENEAAAK